MTQLHEKAYAKLNLTLDVLSRRPDGYHDLQMVMQSVSLCDDVCLRVDDSGDWRIRGSGLPMPEDAGNLAWKAAECYFAGSALRPGLEISIEKRIPSEAGLAGGSSDAAAVLRALNRHFALYSEPELAARALQVGSDVPYCLAGGTKLAEGRGERLSQLPALPACAILIVKPRCAISTPELFGALDSSPVLLRPELPRMRAALERGDLRSIGALLCNVFEPLAMRHHPEIGAVLALLRESHCLGAAMTGTGSACFALYQQPERAQSAREAALRKGFATFLENPV